MVRKTCPHCHTTLDPRRAKGTLVYCCETCFGFTFRLIDIRKLGERASAVGLWRTALRSPISEEVACPHCQKPMRSLLSMALLCA